MPVNTRSGNSPRKRTRKNQDMRIRQNSIDLDDIESDLNFPHIPMHTHYDNHDRTNKDSSHNEEKSNLEGDRINVLVLMFLYVLQGIPLGLAGSIPMLLQARNISYKDQALFSFVFWPFSLKLLWAPIVDAAYFPQFGRRKSWLIPTQYLIGVFMLFLSTKVNYYLGDEDGGSINVTALTVLFFCLTFLAATQDIAVDGWALTMLKRRNVGWASTCNSVGQTAGYFLGNVFLLALESADFCNKYLRSEPQAQGIVTLASFLQFWGIVFFVTTTLVWWFKQEKNDEDADNEYGIIGTYKQLLHIFRLPAVMSLIVTLLTVKIGFAATDAVTGLKLIEAGVPKESLAMLAVPLVPVQIVLTLVISRFTAGPRPLDITLKAMPIRLIMGLQFALMVYWANHIKTGEHEFPFYFYIAILISYGFHQIALYSMFVSSMAFYAKISDPAVGGTYMTLLNTLNNLGGNWPATVALWFVDGLTWKNCESAEGSCYTEATKEACVKDGGKCVTVWDGYYIETIICTCIGFTWLAWRGRKYQRLQDLDRNAWKVSN